MIIRKAKLSDCKECQLLSNSPELLNPDGSLPKIEWFRNQIKQKQILFVAEDNKKIIGYILGDYLAGEVVIIHFIIVKKEYQNKGIGKKLLKKVEDISKKKRRKVIVLYGYAKSKKTVSFFEKNKYKKGNLYYEFMKFI